MKPLSNFSSTFQELYDVWVQMEPHPLQAQEPDGDRHWISSYPVLKVS